MAYELEDMVGKRFGLLTITGAYETRTRNGERQWRAVCDCGMETIAAGWSLRVGRTTSCGRCARLGKGGKVTHGMHRSREYVSWKGMIERCTSPTCKDYARYGAVGITVCDRWRSFENFYADMGPRPEGRTIDRIDGTRGYEPDNCRWATPKEQASNRRPPRKRVFVEISE